MFDPQKYYQKNKAKFDAAEVEGLQALKNLSDPDPEVRFQAAKWICKQVHRETSNLVEFWVGNKHATGALAKALGDTDERVAEQAVLALAQTSWRYFADPSVFPAVLPLLQSKRPGTRGGAADAAAKLGGEASLAHVLPLITDPIGGVRYTAIRSLSHAIHPRPWETPVPLPPPDQRLPHERPTSAQGLKQICDAVVPALQDKVVLVRNAAAGLLGWIGDESVMPYLETASRKERRVPAKDTMKMAVERLKKRLNAG